MSENIQEYIDEIESILDSFSAFDVLSKSGFVAAFIYTDFFKKIKGNLQKYKDLSRFVNAYYMTHKNNATRTLNYETYEKLSTLIENIHFCYLRNSFRDDKNINSIRSSKDITTEIFQRLKTFQMNTLFEYQNEILKKKYDVDFAETLDEIHKFYQKMYNPKIYIKGNSLKETINNFDNIFDTTNLEFKGMKSSKIIDSVATGVGEIDSKLFSYENPLYTFDVGRKCAFNFDNKYYVFDDDIFVSRLCKCVERSCCDFKTEWNNNLKKWTEEVPTILLSQYMKNGQCYLNNYYFPSGKKNRRENDLLFLYKNNLFVIEIKGEKVNPDPLSFDERKIEESYVGQVEKGIEQTITFIENLITKGKVDIYTENNDFVVSLENKFDNIIPIVIIFEEMPAFLPDYMIHNHHDEKCTPVVLNVYDFLVILDYLNNPFYIIDYFVERSKITNKNSFINDELLYLGIYTLETVHLSSFISENSILQRNGLGEKDSIGSFFFDTQGYYKEIELYYSNCGEKKPQFRNINPFMIDMLNTDYSKIDDKTFGDIYKFIKGVPPITHDRLVEKYIAGLSEVVLTLKDVGIGFYIPGNKYLTSKRYYAFLLQYFSRNQDINYVTVAKNKNGIFEYERVYRNSVIFYDKDIIELSKDYSLSWKQTKQ